MTRDMCDVCGGLNSEIKLIYANVDKEQVDGGLLYKLGNLFRKKVEVKVYICQTCISSLFRKLDSKI